jgi:TRAP-type C4-dicarboxylate transport system permease small subunit
MLNETQDSPGARAGETGLATRIVRTTRAVEEGIGTLCRGVLLATGLSLLVILTIIVILRYMGGRSIDSGSELSALIFPIFVMAGIVEAARVGAHVATQLLLHALKDQWRTRLALLIHVVTATVYLYLSTYAYRNAIIAHEELSTTLQVPGSLGYGCLATGLALVGVCSLCAVVRLTLGNEKVVINLADAGPGVV